MSAVVIVFFYKFMRSLELKVLFPQTSDTAHKFRRCYCWYIHTRSFSCVLTRIAHVITGHAANLLETRYMAAAKATLQV